MITAIVKMPKEISEKITIGDDIYVGRITLGKAIFIFDNPPVILYKKIERIDIENYTFLGVTPIKKTTDWTVGEIDYYYAKEREGP